MTDREKLLQQKTLYLNKIKQVDLKILELQEEKREYNKTLKALMDDLEGILQGSLF